MPGDSDDRLGVNGGRIEVPITVPALAAVHGRKLATDDLSRRPRDLQYRLAASPQASHVCCRFASARAWRPDPDRWHTDADEAIVRIWLRDIRPLRWIPRLCRIPYIVSFRLEKHRPIIEAWLRRWHIRVDNLILHPAETFATRDANFDVVRHKAERFKQSDCSLFFESCPQQSAIIAKHAGKPVCCPANGQFYFGK
jgi:hypothetical protein